MTNQNGPSANHQIVSSPVVSSPPCLLAPYWKQVKEGLFPLLLPEQQEPNTIDLTGGLRRLAQILEVVRVEEHVPAPVTGKRGREAIDRRPLARAFLAKAVLSVTDTRQLIEQLHQSKALRGLCGMNQVPSEATFSRAFATFARQNLGDQIQAALVSRFVAGQVVMHLSHDTTAVEAREKAKKKCKPVKEKKSEGAPRRERCGLPRNRPAWSGRWTWRPRRRFWSCPTPVTGASRRILMGTSIAGEATKPITHPRWVPVWADGMIPLRVVTTSASVHDSQGAIPMMKQVAEQVTSLYDLMDSAYDAPSIKGVSQSLGHVPLIDKNPRRGSRGSRGSKGSGFGGEKKWYQVTASQRRYGERSNAERGNSRLKDSFGLRFVRVRGPEKVHLHTMFGVLALFADQLLKSSPATRDF